MYEISFGSGGRSDNEAESKRNPRKVKAYLIRLAMKNKNYITQMQILALALEKDEPPKKPDSFPEVDSITH